MKARLSIFGAALLVSACAVGPDYVPPAVSLPNSFVAQPSDQGTVDTTWWRRFDDVVLDDLIADALRNSLTLEAAKQRFAAAQAVTTAAQREYLPSGGALLQAERGRLSSLDARPTGDRDTRSVTAGLAAAWEADVVGRVGRSVEAATAEQQAEEALLEDARRVLVADLTRSYVLFRAYQVRLQIAEASVVSQQRTLSIVQSKLEIGRGNGFDVARAAAQVSSTSAHVPVLRAEVQAQLFRIAALCGRPPGTFGQLLSATQDQTTPEIGAVGDPVQLLMRRPDLRAAERRLAAATARIGIVTADLYPRVTLDAAAGWAAPTGSGLGDGPYGFYSLLPRISWAFLDIPRVQSRIRAAGARAEEASALFKQQVLLALEETDRALAGYGQQRERITQLTQLVRHTENASSLAGQRYRDGAASFLDVLDAERSRLEAQDRLAIARQEAATSFIAVYAALGG